MFHGSLRIDVGAHRLQRRTANAPHVIGAVPEHGLGVEGAEVLGESRTRAPRSLSDFRGFRI